MSSLQIVLRRKPNRQKKFPLAIRITKNRRTSYLSTGQYIDEKEWDASRRLVRKSHANYKALNNLLLNKLAEANDKVLKAETEDQDISLLTIRKKVKGDNHMDFFAIAYEHLENLKNAEKFRQYETQRANAGHSIPPSPD